MEFEEININRETADLAMAEASDKSRPSLDAHLLPGDEASRRSVRRKMAFPRTKRNRDSTVTGQISCRSEKKRAPGCDCCCSFTIR
jgi:hypothetical protein